MYYLSHEGGSRAAWRDVIRLINLDHDGPHGPHYITGGGDYLAVRIDQGS